MRLPGLLFVAVMSMGSAAFAAPPSARPSPPSEQRARAEALFRDAQEHYRAGRFAEAVAVLLELRNGWDDPILIYNLARAYEGLADSTKAIAAYEEYLAAAPNAPDRGGVQRHVETLRAQLAERRRLEEESHRARTTRSEPKPNPWPWVTLGAGAAVLAASAGFGIAAKASERDGKEATTAAAGERARDRGERQATIANVGFVAGGVIATTGIVWVVLASTRGKTAAVSIAPNGAALTGTFY